MAIQLPLIQKVMRKIFLIEKIEAGKSKYLQMFNNEIYWNENIKLAYPFKNEDEAIASILRLSEIEVDSFLQIIKVYQKL